MNDFKVNLENLTNEERSQLLKLIEKANIKESKIWKPNLEERYYYVSDQPVYPNGIATCGWEDDLIDNYRYSMGNCFKTKEEVEFAQERQKVLVELERFAKEHNENNKLGEPFILTFDNYSGRIKVSSALLNCGNILVRFSSADIAKQAAEIIGADRLIKYYFGVK